MNSTIAFFRSGRAWALFPVVILAPLMLLQLFLVHRALSDPSFAVEDRYYAKALSWDTNVAARRESARLGWQAKLNVDSAAPGAPNLSLALFDRDGAPVTKAHVEVDAFAVARSSQVVHLILSEPRVGSYQGLLDAKRAGLWELSVRASRGTDRFTSVVRRDLVGARP